MINPLERRMVQTPEDKAQDRERIRTALALFTGPIERVPFGAHGVEVCCKCGAVFESEGLNKPHIPRKPHCAPCWRALYEPGGESYSPRDNNNKQEPTR